MAYKAGHVALIGKPNVGKSTLLNHVVGQKVSIVSNKPQTTRKRVLGISTTHERQVAFLDTPGIHEPHTTLARAMVEQARSALGDADVVLVVVDGAHHPGEDDERIADLLKKVLGAGTPEAATRLDPEGNEVEFMRQPYKIPVLICMNKMDMLKPENVLRNVEAYTRLFGTDAFMMTTATQGHNVDRLMEMVVGHLPERAPIYDEDSFTDQSSRFLAAELVREKILIATRQEVPHATAVIVDDWEEEKDLVRILATILVEKASQRGILIGKGGQFLKNIGTRARAEIEGLVGKKVFLELHVKVAEGWRMNPRILHELDYEG